MRIIALAALCTTLALPAQAQAQAQAQQVKTISAVGANAAGACAGSFEMIAQTLCTAQNPDLQRLAAYSKARDFFATMPQFPAADIQQAGQAFITLMSGRIRNAETPEIRSAVQRELLDLAKKCLVSTNYTVKLTQDVEYCPPAPEQPLQTQPLTTQPLAAEPLQTQPYVTQPYEIQPLVLDPVVPAQ